ncbi:flavo protein family [Aspergillus ellipticus CBS 707.79]|uniref:Flavo protein family n=1 Tax=Aspergillus ellipticus CBS 707.79 TaxID=1448320 RepID=A0A319DUS6_9EURO|nr:flavo protein family [Aspergillus ellipticus CBS 707.79]
MFPTPPWILPLATSTPTPTPTSRHKRIIVALTGATGTIVGIRALLALRRLHVETHLILSKWAETTVRHETSYTVPNVRSLADHVYRNNDLAAPIASVSFRVDGMILIPCSMKTLAAITIGFGEDLVARAADNMLSVTRHGAVVFLPVPAFYTRPAGLEEVVDRIAGRVLDLFGLEIEGLPRWKGLGRE